MSIVASAIVQTIGMTAAVLTTASFLPQAIKAIRSGRTKDLSLVMYVTLTLGVALWLVYGLLLGEWPLILANAVTLILAATVLAMKIRYG